jgi:hypothetical protein
MTPQKNMYSKSKKQWNPFVGCGFDCLYCKPSFKRQVQRVGYMQQCEDCKTYKPHYHENRLEDSFPRTKEDEFIFTCASGDISFCSTPFFKKIIQVIESKADRTFLLQSKNPATFNRVEIPENVMLGITLESNRDDLVKAVSKAPAPSKRVKDFLVIDHSRKTVTIEPILSFDHDVMLKMIKDINPEMIWLGFNSKIKPVLPEPTQKEFNNLHKALKKEGFKVTLKAAESIQI